MTFLKVISALAVALFLLVLLNNFTDYFFGNRSDRASIYEDPSKGCYDKYPYPAPIPLDINGQPTNVDSSSAGSSAQAVAFSTPDDANMKAREKCSQEALASVADQAVIAQQNALIRGSVVFVLLLIASILLFKTAPFLAGGLLLGGVSYMMFQYFSLSMYPFGMMGWGGYGGNGPSADILARSQLVKGGLSGVALILLVLGHLFFFEKNSKKN